MKPTTKLFLLKLLNNCLILLLLPFLFIMFCLYLLSFSLESRYRQVQMEESLYANDNDR